MRFFLILSLLLISKWCMSQSTTKQITIGGGCFWCIEAAFEDVKGISSVISGFSGGKIKNPSYREVVTGKTNHAEVCQITYDSKIISLKNILELFFLVHDPTTINRQGNDIGKHYRSIILYHYDEELDFIKNEIDRFNKDYYDNRIVTEIKKFEAFYSAEEYHQEYYKKNSEQPYCKIVIKPKLQKARELLKSYY